jgi:hypothetical protein
LSLQSKPSLFFVFGHIGSRLSRSHLYFSRVVVLIQAELGLEHNPLFLDFHRIAAALSRFEAVRNLEILVLVGGLSPDLRARFRRIEIFSANVCDNRLQLQKRCSMTVFVKCRRQRRL